MHTRLQPLSLTVVPDPGGITIFATGDIDLAARPTVDGALADLSDDGRNLIIDLDGVTFMDSTGLALLVDFHNQRERRGATLTVRSPPPIVRRILELTAVDQILRISSGHADGSAAPG
jgi:anti-sigma B factor antagonist